MSAAAMAGGAEKIVQQISKAVAHHGIVDPAYKSFTWAWRLVERNSSVSATFCMQNT